MCQVWFSTCWDARTQTQFTSFVKRHETSSTDDLLHKFAKVWLAKMPVTVVEAQAKHSEILSHGFCEPLLNLKRKVDRVKFCRHLLTGCLFVDEAKA